MLRKSMVLLTVVVLALVLVIPVAAAPGAPNFGAGLWADGERWGTKVTTVLPAPGPNEHSFDPFYFIVGEGWTVDDGMGGWLQAPVMESAPTNPAYNGGRWVTIKVTVHDESVLPLMSAEDVMAAASSGAVSVDSGPSSDGTHPSIYFQCPLLPLK